ncbi:hypothetical protein [Nocardia sp. NPDC004604]|uniref:hypothetical protein n=1 Tax=Nocardia sp. NPDC004604 TaxID=3157013 RepID=UPI0033A65193
MGTRSVLRVGDRVVFDGDEHSVVGLSGGPVRLRADSGVEQVVLAAYVMAAVDFAVLDAAPQPAVEPFGLRMWLLRRSGGVSMSSRSGPACHQIQRRTRGRRMGTTRR